MSDVLELQDVTVVREGRALVDQVSWSVKEGERWVILGPNGAGKTTLLNVASSYLYPSSGTATILGETLGRPGTDVFELRPRIGVAGIAMADKLPKRQTVLQTVLTAAYGMTAGWQEEYEDIDEQRARAFLDRLGMTEYLDRRFGTLSEGERKRTLIAPGFTHVLMIRQGQVLAAGPLELELTSRNLSLCFGLPLIVEQAGDRWTAKGLPLS